MKKQNEYIKNITVVGTGVIGIGWIARFISQGYHVTAYDPNHEAKNKIDRTLEKVWPKLEAIGLSKNASIERLTFETNLQKSIKNADFIQENAPERENIKRKLIAEIDAYAPKNAIVSSSTSGIMPSILQKDCIYPERVIVAHPFNPVYLIPLVEIVGGKQTKQAVIKRACKFLASLNMKPLVIRKEIEGHVADRLMEAIWREALHIVNDGIATTEEDDASIIYGPGLRWALMGPFMTLHLAGGEEGMRHMLKQFGPALKLPWTKLIAPELTEELANKVIDGCEQQTKGYNLDKLEERRDEFLIELIKLLEKYWPGANLNANL